MTITTTAHECDRPSPPIPHYPPPDWPASLWEWDFFRAHRRDAHCGAWCGNVHTIQDRLDGSLEDYRLPAYRCDPNWEACLGVWV